MALAQHFILLLFCQSFPSTRSRMGALIHVCLRNTSIANKVSGKTEFTMSDFMTDMTKHYSKVKGTRSQKDFPKKIQIVTILNMGIQFVHNEVIGKDLDDFLRMNHNSMRHTSILFLPLQFPI